jgi:hypothetical protein
MTFGLMALLDRLSAESDTDVRYRPIYYCTTRTSARVEQTTSASRIVGVLECGNVLGARVPIILTSRADDVRSHLASCAVPALYAHAKRVAAAGIGKVQG